jgi:hypothetical protein
VGGFGASPTAPSSFDHWLLGRSRCELGKRTEIKLLEPRFARLSEEQRREAVALLADLLLDAARKRARVSDGASASVIHGASGSVVPFPERRGKARRCA